MHGDGAYHLQLPRQERRLPTGEVTLPHYLRPGLRILFIGHNPAIYSAEAGHYYARPGNVFWRHLSASGLAGRPVTHLDDHILPGEAGIGFVDLCCRPTVRAEHLNAAEVAEGALRLHSEIVEFQPEYAVFGSKAIFQEYGVHALRMRRSDVAKREYGVQPERIGRTIPYLIPSSSGLASKYHGLRLQLLHDLRAILERGS